MTYYRGRFAPTPSGPVHLGTLLAALGSYIDARSHQGTWHVRIDDIDPPREVPGAADSILRTLEHYELTWDEEVIYQSQRYEQYKLALDQLNEQGDIFYCECSRKSIEKIAAFGPNGAIYPGTCRQKSLTPAAGLSTRIRTLSANIVVHDLIQGDYHLNIHDAVGDFILKRSDGLYAYHLATVVDDGLDDYTHIVRGEDLLSITPQQVYLQQRLGLKTPSYAHLPLITNNQGIKLSKRSHAKPVDEMTMSSVFSTLLPCLGLHPTDTIDLSNPCETLDWAIKHWKLDTIGATPYVIS